MSGAAVRSTDDGHRPAGRARYAGRTGSPPGRRARRWGIATLVVLLLPVVAVGMQPGPAGADRLNFLCSITPAPTGEEETEPTPVLDNSRVQTFNGIDFLFTGHAPPGVVIPGATPDPVTGITTFTRSVPFRFGYIGMDFLDAADYPGADGADLFFKFEPRLASEAGWLDTRLHELLTENFNVAEDFGPLFGDLDNILLAGLDARILGTRALADLGPGFKAEVSVGVRWKLSDNSTSYTRVGLVLDSTAVGHKFPETTMLGIAFKHDQLDAPVDYVAVHQNIRHYDLDPRNDVQPGFSLGVTVDTLDVEGGRNNLQVVGSDPMLNATTSWNHTPEAFAFGIRSLCKPWDETYSSTAHLGWNVGGLAEPQNANLDIELNLGIDAGQEIDVMEGLDRVTRTANETVVDASIQGMPRRFDAILHPDSLGITRSTDVVPTLDLHKFHTASDDPNTENDLPLNVAGQVVDLPRHALLTAGFDDEGFRSLDISLWDLVCDGEPPPTTPPAPPEVQRNDLDDTFPFTPAGCQRHSLAAATSATFVMQNFLPEDLNAVDATADLAALPLAESQFVHYVSRDVNPLSNEGLYRVGARVADVRRVLYDTSEPPPDGSRMRIYVERATPGAVDDSARVVFDLDRRTDLADEVANQGSRISGDVRIVDLPEALRVDYDTSPARPVHVVWHADAGLALADGEIEVQLAGNPGDPGSGSIRATAQVETGEAVGGLPPAAELQLVEDTDVLGDRTTVLWTAPGPVTDTFPTPTVPAYDPATVSRIHAGAIVTTLAERLAGEQLRIHADIDVPQDVAVAWTSGADGLAEVIAQLCTPGSASCADTRFDATAVSGQATLASDLLVAPELPAISTVASATPPFTDFRPGSGIRAIIPDDGSWGVDGVVRGVERLRYAPDPHDISLVMGPTGPQPFRVNLFTESDDGSTSPSVVYADAALDRLPAQMRAIIRDSGSAGADQPWIWINSEDISISDIGDVDFDATDAPGSRPVLSGVVRVGNVSALASELRAANRITPERSTNGVDVAALYDSSTSTFGVDAVAQLEVPRHVAIWQPALSRCDETTDVADCQEQSTFEIDTIDNIAVEMRTTAASLGDLNARVLLGSPPYDVLDVRAEVETVPGSLALDVALAENRRLPWSAYDFSFEANAPLGTVIANVYERANKVQYREANGDLGALTSNYGVELANVPSELQVQAQIKAAEERITPGNPDPAPSDDEGGGIGYLHAFVDLAPGGRPAASEVLIEARNTTDGNIVATVNTDEAISGFINGRMDRIKVNVDDPMERVSALQIFIEEGGLIGLTTAPMWATNLGYVLSFGILAFLDVLFGLIAELLYAATPVLETVMDFDLPFSLEFDEITTLRFGVNGHTFSIDEVRAGGGGLPLVFAIRQRSLPHEEPLLVPGAYFYDRFVRYKYDSTLEDWDFTVESDNEFEVVGLYDWHECKDTKKDPICALPGRGFDNIVRIDAVATDPRLTGATSADIILDLLFTPERRDYLDDKDGGVVATGRKTYEGLADAAPPLTGADFRMPELVKTDFLVSGASDIRTEVYWTPRTQFLGAMYYGDCTFTELPTRAVGADGTKFLVTPLCYEPSRTPTDRVFGLNLSAVHEGEVERWSVRLPNPVGYETDDDGNPTGDAQCEDISDIDAYDKRRCEIDVDLNPRPDGSVQIRMRTYRGGDLIGTKRAWVDASGYPAFDLPGAAEVPNFDATELSIGNDGVVVISPPAVEEGRWYEYVYGDGDRTGRIAFNSPVPDTTAHVYPDSPDTDYYLAMLLVYDDDGEVMDKEYFEITG